MASTNRSYLARKWSFATQLTLRAKKLKIAKIFKSVEKEQEGFKKNVWINFSCILQTFDWNDRTALVWVYLPLTLSWEFFFAVLFHGPKPVFHLPYLGFCFWGSVRCCSLFFNQHLCSSECCAKLSSGPRDSNSGFCVRSASATLSAMQPPPS